MQIDVKIKKDRLKMWMSLLGHHMCVRKDKEQVKVL